jgi:hypothetical protein
LITLALGSMLIGALLGVRFRVIILPSAILLGIGAVAIVCCWQRVTFLQTGWAMVVFASLLQAGYVCGGLCRALIPRTSLSEWFRSAARQLQRRDAA